VVAADGADAAPPPTYLPPVDAPVVDGFRPPTRPYGPGNRGLEYDTVAGAEVRAAADGRVTFAGQVAGSRHVTVLHEDGLRTTYSFLERIDVLAGQEVRQGQVVGTTAGRLHLSARSGDLYLDPAALFDGGLPQVRLVPFDEPPGPGASGERSAIRQFLGGVGRVVGGVAHVADVALDQTVAWLGSAVDAGAEMLASKAQLLRTLLHYAHRIGTLIDPVRFTAMVAGLVARAWIIARRSCTSSDAEVAPPAERRVAILVAGLGSTSGHASIDDVDVGQLGYEADDVLRFSYEGGRTPADGGGALADIAATTYDAADSQADLRRSGEHLADLIEEVAASAGGAPIDLLAHSQGGVVVRLALIELEERHGTAWLDGLGLVATLGTPHRGADLATAVHAFGETFVGGALLDEVDALGDLSLKAGAPSPQQLGETSTVIRELAEHPVPESVPFVSIAARGDLIVPAPNTGAAGAVQVIVPLMGLTAHSDLPGSPEALRELSLALAGAPPGCRSFDEALVDVVGGEVISLAEDAVGAAAWGLGMYPTASR